MFSTVLLQVCASLAVLRCVFAQADKCSCTVCGNQDKARAFAGGTSLSVDESFPGKGAIPGSTGPHPVIGDAHTRPNATMLVLLAGLGDARCAGTIANVFTRAKNPERMRVGIVDQNRPADSGYDCVATYCAVMEQRGFATCPHLDQIETLRIDAGEARGPAWARAAGAQFVRTDEHDFCLQVDAHTDFLSGYDVVLPKMWAQTGNEYAVLSTYVNDVSGQLTKDGDWGAQTNYEVPVLCGVGGGDLHRNTIASAASCLTRPILSRTMGAGLTFSKCHFEARVPNDPFLTGVFDGEEFSRFLRGWTYGYDVYAPQRAVVFHDYNRQQFHTGAWSAHAGEEGSGSQRISLLMSGKAGSFAEEEPVKDPKKNMGYYGLGRARSLAHFEEFSGIRVRSSEAGDDDKHCASLRYVPYAEEPATVLAAPLPPLETSIPRSVVTGSDKAKWPDPAVLHASFKTDAQQFVLSEIASVGSGHRLISFAKMLDELGIDAPPTRSSRGNTISKSNRTLSGDVKSVLLNTHRTYSFAESSRPKAQFLRGPNAHIESL